MLEAAQLVRERHPDLIVDGEMQADTAVNPDIAERIFPFCEIKGGANIFIFPNLGRRQYCLQVRPAARRQRSDWAIPYGH